MIMRHFRAHARLLAVCGSLFAQGCAAAGTQANIEAVGASTVVNDVTQLNPVRVARIVAPRSVEEIQQLVRGHQGPLSIGGGRYSQGGQTATDNALQLDMREFNKILDISRENKTLTVQAGATWRQIQDAIDPLDLSIKIMQTYSNFTVGGSLSVNVHGRYVGQGPLIRSVRSIKLVLADGTLVECGPHMRTDVFHAAIGGYGGIGVIVEATLDLADNVRVERRVQRMPAADYRAFFVGQIRNDPEAVFTNGDIYPPDFDTVNSVTWYRTDKPVTVPDRLIPRGRDYVWEPRVVNWVASVPFGRDIREHLLDPWYYRDESVVWRNHEASYDVAELEPERRDKTTFVLQEYFVPVGRFDEFVPKMGEVFRAHDVDVVNVSIRHALPDPGSLLAWAREEVFAFVVYYRQGTQPEDRNAVRLWTREMIDAALSVGGTYYLPYQPHATEAQFLKAYPRAPEYFAAKAKLDPTGKFRNKLLDRYLPTPDNALMHAAESAGPMYARNEASTYYTIPEWYIVFNPEEYAAHLKDKPPSGFPYFSSIGEFWSLYGTANDLAEPYPFDFGAHLMLMVIGTSYTAELLVKGSYENTFGRLSEWTASPELTEEDRQIQRYHEEYVKFIYVRPWYEYPFWDKLGEFWERSTWDEDNRFREIERSVSFSMEFAVKAAYGWLIGLGSAAAYETDAGTIYAHVRNLPGDAATIDERMKVLTRVSDGRALIAAPRYEPFREIAQKLAARGVAFDEISGNDEIMLTVIAPKGWTFDLEAGESLFESKVVSDPSIKRVGIRAKVQDLSQVLNALAPHGLRIEHLYDY